MKAEEIFEPGSLAVYADAVDEPMIKEPGTDDVLGKHNKIKKSGGGDDQSKKKNQ